MSWPGGSRCPGDRAGCWSHSQGRQLVLLQRVTLLPGTRTWWTLTQAQGVGGEQEQEQAPDVGPHGSSVSLWSTKLQTKLCSLRIFWGVWCNTDDVSSLYYQLGCCFGNVFFCICFLLQGLRPNEEAAFNSAIDKKRTWENTQEILYFHHFEGAHQNSLFPFVSPSYPCCIYF